MEKGLRTYIFFGGETRNAEPIYLSIFEEVLFDLALNKYDMYQKFTNTCIICILPYTYNYEREREREREREKEKERGERQRERERDRSVRCPCKI